MSDIEKTETTEITETIETVKAEFKKQIDELTKKHEDELKKQNEIIKSLAKGYKGDKCDSDLDILIEKTKQNIKNIRG
jgi:predicted nucleotidyltransferase